MTAPESRSPAPTNGWEDAGRAVASTLDAVSAVVVVTETAVPVDGCVPVGGTVAACTVAP